MRLSVLNAVVFLSSLWACSGDGVNSKGDKSKIVDSASGTVILGLGARIVYRPVALPTSGSVTGTVSVQGAPMDSMVATSRDARICGDSARVSEVRPNGTSLANALVWVDGIVSGKALPEGRRETITIERCRFEPRVMGVVAGSTINVFSRDRVTHDSRFYREGAGTPVGHVYTMDEGQVVPSEGIASAPGIVEARCALHPWSRGYVAVFEHPYFAVTDERGAFEIAGLPPGTYPIKIWHEGLAKPVEQQVTIGAGGAGRVDVALAVK